MPSPPKGLYRFGLLYSLLFLFTAPWPHEAVPCPGSWLRPLTAAAAGWTGKHVFRLAPGFTAELHSDSTGLYLHLFNLLIAGLMLYILLSAGRLRSFRPGPLAAALLRYFLAYQLLIYGWNKLFKWQFYLPEPNTLYTPTGQTTPDLLYWSTLGASRPYVMALGLLELLAAALLLIRLAARAGAGLAVFVFTQVLLVNFCFDISVKVLSAFLLLLSLLLLAPAPEPARRPPLAKGARGYLGACLAALLLADSLLPYLRSRNFNDDAEPRPPLHGAYEVVWFIRDGDTLPPLTTDTFRWRRAFVHRRGYFIVQHMNDAMQDFELEYDPGSAVLWLSAPADSAEQAWDFQLGKESLRMQGRMGDDSVSVGMRRLNLSALPLLQPSFHWTTER